MASGARAHETVGHEVATHVATHAVVDLWSFAALAATMCAVAVVYRRGLATAR